MKESLQEIIRRTCGRDNAQGNWQLRITDRAGLGTGTLNGWKVDVYGSDFNETIPDPNYTATAQNDSAWRKVA